MTNKLLYLIAPRKIAERKEEELLEGSPASLLYLGAWVKRNVACDGVRIIRNASEIVTGQDNYVGISVTTPTYQEGLRVAREVRFRDHAAIIILGGYHTKGQGEVIVGLHSEIDFVVEGQGEKALVDILNGSTKGKVITGSHLSSSELDLMDVGSLKEIDPEYFRTMRQFDRMNYISSRGCGLGCSFCANDGVLVANSTERVADDLERLVNLGHDKISIQDNSFGYNRQRLVQICRELKRRGVKADFDCQARVETISGLTSEQLNLIKEIGFSGVYLGTENLHPAVIERIGKASDGRQYLARTQTAVRNLLAVGINPYLCLQVGVPGEDEQVRIANVEGLRELGRFARNEPIKVYSHLNVVYPGTKDYRSLVGEGSPAEIFENFTKDENLNKQIAKMLGANGFIHGAGGIPLYILNRERLKNGEFELSEEKIQEINDYVGRLRKIKGIDIYIK